MMHGAYNVKPIWMFKEHMCVNHLSNILKFRPVIINFLKYVYSLLMFGVLEQQISLYVSIYGRNLLLRDCIFCLYKPVLS